MLTRGVYVAILILAWRDPSSPVAVVPSNLLPNVLDVLIAWTLQNQASSCLHKFGYFTIPKSESEAHILFFSPQNKSKSHCRKEKRSSLYDSVPEIPA